MPNPNLSDQQITDVVAFLAWVSRIDNQGWPPRPILVKGSAVPGASVAGLPAPPATRWRPASTSSARPWPASHGVEDTRQAVAEAWLQGIHVFGRGAYALLRRLLAG